MLKSMCPLLRQARVHPETPDGNRLVFRPPLWQDGGQFILFAARLYEELPSIRANIAPITV
jgi:hypothetical protein